MYYEDKVYGGLEIREPVLVDVFNSKALKRLKGVNQYGTWCLIRPELNTSRFEHSVGVMILLRKLGADIKEQLAGLIHDVAHTAFSHVVDYVYGQERDQTFHEDFAKEFVATTDLPGVLQKYGFKWEELLDEGRFKLLEQSIPTFALTAWIIFCATVCW